MRAVCACSLFPSPLFIALGGRSSFVYLFDIAWLASVPHLIRNWHNVDSMVKRIALSIVTGAGLLPLIGSGLGWDAFEPTLQNAINAYRLGVFVWLLMLVSAAPEVPREGRLRVLSLTSVFSIVLMCAVLLQLMGIADSNVFHMEVGSDSPGSLLDARLDERVAVMGLFRGAMGIAFTSAFIVGLGAVQAQREGGRALPLVGAGCAVIGASLIASKTTLAAMALVSVLLPLVSVAAGSSAVFLTAGGVVCALVPWIDRERVDALLLPVLVVLGTSTEGVATFTGRAGIWSATMSTLREDPGRLLGIASRGELEPAVGVYHNEFLAVLMTGGLLALALYCAALWMMARRLFGNVALGGALGAIGALLFIAMCVQAMLVAHLQPNLFFAPALVPLAVVYGMALRRNGAEVARS